MSDAPTPSPPPARAPARAPAPASANGQAAPPIFRPVAALPPREGMSSQDGLELLRRRRAEQLGGPEAPEPARTAPEPTRTAPEPNGADEGESEGDGGSEPVPSYELVIEGKATKVSLPELLQGYLRTADYTRKTQAVTQGQQEVQQTLAAFQQERDRYAQQLTRFVAQEDAEFAGPIDWVKLAREDPLGWQEKKARFDVLQEARAEQARIAQQRQLEEQVWIRDRVRQGHEVLSKALPGWSEPAKRQEMQQTMRDYALTVGYTEEELARDVLDPRQLMVLHDAAIGRRMQGQKVTPQPADAGRPAPRGTPPQPKPNRREEAARQQFDTKRDMRSALDVMKHIRGRQP